MRRSLVTVAVFHWSLKNKYVRSPDMQARALEAQKKLKATASSSTLHREGIVAIPGAESTMGKGSETADATLELCAVKKTCYRSLNSASFVTKFQSPSKINDSITKKRRTIFLERTLTTAATLTGRIETTRTLVASCGFEQCVGFRCKENCTMSRQEPTRR